VGEERLPSYDELPVRDGAPRGSSWGVWGDRDVFGCLNLLTPERAVGAAGLVRKGATFALNWDMGLPDPPLFGRPAFQHQVHWLANEVGHDDELSGWNTQSSSQWDGFRHIRSPEYGFYAGVADEDHGIHHWAARGLVGRAVLVDVARFLEGQGRPISMDSPHPIEPDDVAGAARAQGVDIRTGDVLLIRTGWISWYRGLDADRRRAMAESFATPGLRPGIATARFLWDLHVAAVAGDNPALEVWPPGALATPEQLQESLADPDKRAELFCHFSLLPLLGLPIGEMWDLDALAEDCAADGVYEGLFTSAPLNLRAGVASPPNALVVK
ncbi:MAG TPA: cyclase family protein, partial [Acidimicrobiales bacterium]|nr:cyclase family protein [Acidimicrobiales bacterium]